MPSDRLRKLEIEANNAFDQYRDLWVAGHVHFNHHWVSHSVEGPPCCFSYFEGGVSSVYLWDLDHGFAGVILIKKAGDGSKKIKGCWDSIHVVEVQVRQLTWGCAWIHSALFGYPTEIFHRCWSADSFPCRRSPAAVLLTINSPPLSCCGFRQPNLVPVLWTWEAALQDRYDAQPPPVTTCPEVVAGSHPFTCFSQMEKDDTVGESSPHIANIGRLVEVS